MRSGTWNGEETDDNVRVTVNGTVRPVKDVSIQSGMKDGHPLSETSSWCIEATIAWADPKIVTADSPHPFGAGTDWLPQGGDEVVIETGDGALGQWWVQHRGYIDSTSGSIADGTAVSKTIDDIQELDKNVKYGALLSKMTPVRDGEPFRYQGLKPIWYVDRMLRDESWGGVGWHATPPVTWHTVASVTALGSLGPEVGTLQTAEDPLSPDTVPLWTTTPDGHPIASRYTATTTFTHPVRKFVFTFSLPMSDNGTDHATIQIFDENGRGPTIRTDGPTIFYRHADQSEQTIDRNNAHRVAVSYEHISTTEQLMTIRLDDGREVVNNWTSGNYPTTWHADRVVIESSKAVGWWMVEEDKPAGQEWYTLESTPTMRIRLASIADELEATPRVDSTAAQWLEEQITAECAAAWLNEDGHFEWCGRRVLDEQEVHQVASSSLNVDEIGWTDDHARVARSVVVKFEDSKIDLAFDGSFAQKVWESSSLDMGPFDEEIIQITTPGDEDWVDVDLSPHHLTAWGLAWDQYVIGSTFGGTQYRMSDTDQAAWAAFMDCTMTKTSLHDYEVTVAPWDSVALGQRVKTEWPPPTATSAVRAGSPLTMRARARVRWVEGEMSADTRVTVGPPRYVHEAGRRAQQQGAGLANLTAYLTTALNKANEAVLPVVSVTLAHDPRRQIGDKVRIEDRDVTGTWIEMLVQERDTDVGGFTDVIRGRVTAHGDLTDVSLPSPHGPTPLAPASNWNREVA